jgi:flavin reductase (DIM6/NTAB) family NADH-FMN oxidoreductase RutF
MRKKGMNMKIVPGDMARKDFYNMLMAAIHPRPIAWVSTVGADGVFNLAPFSFFQAVSAKPPVVCFSVASKRDGRIKDTLRNVESGKDFVLNTVNEDLAEVMNQTSAEYPPEVDEFKETGLTPIKSDLVKSPRVAESSINMECQVNQIIQYGQSPEFGNLIIGDVVCMHVKDEYCVDGQVDGWKLNNIGRLWGKYYCRITDTFEMTMPGPFPK